MSWYGSPNETKGSPFILNHYIHDDETNGTCRQAHTKVIVANSQYNILSTLLSHLQLSNQKYDISFFLKKMNECKS